MNELKILHENLQNHIIYKSLNNHEDLKTFMKWHAFAVWDFMSLLKSLQNSITCTTIPWRPSVYPKDLVRFINEIVLGEESDQSTDGGYTDHFSMYLNAMEEVDSDTSLVLKVMQDLDFEALPLPVKNFVSYNINLSLNGEVHEVCAAFFYGRENLVPSIFEPIVKEINENKLNCPNFLYYLERHIELDGEEHGQLAQKCLDILVGQDDKKREEASEVARISLNLRKELWDFIHAEIVDQKSFVDLSH